MSIAPALDSAAAELLPCADSSRSAGDSPIGSGTEFDSFLLLDYRRPWGHNVAVDAVRDLLTPEAQHALSARRRLRPFAIRPVRGRRESPVQSARVGTVGLHAAMRYLPDRFGANDIAAGQRMTGTGGTAAEVTIGICTNAKRDQCCAVRGRPVAVALEAEFGARISEISHLGGHRYAATMVVLPTGYSYGFLEPASARDVVAAALDGLVHPANLRGRADLTPEAQAADAYWRRGLGPAPVGDVRVTSERVEGIDPNGFDVVLVEAVVQGATDRVRVRRDTGAVVPMTACGGKPIATGRWVVEAA